MRHLLCAGTIAALAFLYMGAAGAADTELPDAAKKAFQEKYKDVKSYKVKTENEKGTTIYEVKFNDANGIENEVELTADGKIVSEAHDVKTADVPKAVKDAVEKAYPGASIDEAKVETEKGTTGYELEIKTKDNKKVEVEVSADGSKLKVEDGEADEKDEKK